MQGLIAIMLDFISIVRQFCLSMIETGYRHFGNRRSNGLFILLLIPVLQSCSGPRAVTGMAVPENQLIKASVQVPFLVASTRQRAADMNAVFTRDRAESVKFSRVDVRIPESHQPGNVETSRGTIDPNRHFSATNYSSIADSDAMLNELNRQLSQRKHNQREIFIFVHGYNNNFAESLFRNAQIVHDYSITALPIHFSWASAGNFQGYLHDRDSALIARVGLAKTLQIAARSKSTGIILVGHSMGALVVMEALRTLSLDDRKNVLKKIKGVLLAAPDLDPDLFRSQVEDIDYLPWPFTIVVSQRDRALSISRILARGQPRIGSGSDIASLQGKDIQVLDVTSLENGGHSVFASSPTLISLLGSGHLLRRLMTDEYAAKDENFVSAGRSILAQTSLILHLPAKAITRIGTQ